MSHTTYELTRCLVCDALDNTEIADDSAMQLETNLLRTFHERRLRPGVPPEHLMDRVTFSQSPPFRLSQCRHCSHLYRNPQERYESLEAAYDTLVPDDSVLQALFHTQRGAYQAQVQRLTAVMGHTGRGLEVGSYVGGFLAAASSASWTFNGVDTSARMARFATRNGFKVMHGEIEDVVMGQPFDVIAIWNTFEQLYNARSALLAAQRLLRTGGVIVVRIPNGDFYVNWRKQLSGPLGSVATRLLAHNNLLTFPYRQGFTMRSLTLLLEQCHFEIEKTFGDTLVPIADAWTTTYGTIEERLMKSSQRFLQHGWHAPWVEVYARSQLG
jgi:SAM-dependent methyltransferase